MRKIFLDLGTHHGQGINEIVRLRGIDNTWKIFSFEANPITFNSFDRKNFRPDLNIKFFNKAVGIDNKQILLNIETTDEGDIGQGSSIIEMDKWNSPLHYGKFIRQVTVSSFDLSSFILKNFTDSDLIIIKMDIEGSEYDVLEKMIADSSINLVSEIYLEFHGMFFSNKEEIQYREQKILDELKSKNIIIHGPLDI
jgi:FkbM family methyltransferase